MSVNILKKVFPIFGLITVLSILSSLILRSIAFGASSDDNACTIFACGGNVAAKYLQLNIPDGDWTDIFGTDDPKKAGQDLYKKIYGMTNVIPERKAVKNISGKFGTTESNLLQLLNNDFSPIMEHSPHLTQQEAVNKMFEIQQRFQEEKDLLDLEADVKATVEPNEIFANGNIDDSGFDLVNDLDNIQNILFKKIDPIDIGGTYDATGESSPAAKETSRGGSRSVSIRDTTTSDPAYSGIVAEKIPETGTKTRVLPLKKYADKYGTEQKSLPPTVPAAAVNSNICVVENNLNKSLQDFAQNQLKDSRFKETPTRTEQKSLFPSWERSRPFPTDKTAADIPEFTYSDTTPPTPLKPASADNWLKKLPCNDIFCLKVNFIKKPATATYRDADNCIACHIEKIDEKLKQTINHSLVPAKATGNLLEPGLCKSATFDLLGSGLLGLRFHAVSKPVLTPTNDDLIYGSSIVQEWEKFTNTYKPFPFEEKRASEPKSDDETSEPPSDETEKAAVKSLAEAGESTKQEDILKTIQRQSEKSAQEREKAISVAETAIQSDVASGFYQAIARELEQMNYYFDSFRDMLGSLHKRVTGGEGACVLLKSKKECT